MILNFRPSADHVNEIYRQRRAWNLHTHCRGRKKLPDHILKQLPLLPHIHREELLKDKHFRNLYLTLAFFAREYAGIEIMPNLLEPVLTGEDAMSYKEVIEYVLADLALPLLELVMSIQITDATTPEMIFAARRLGVRAAKIYPLGVTTNSSNGVKNIRNLTGVLAAMQEPMPETRHLDSMLLLLHPEEPGVFTMDRSNAYLPTLEWLHRTFPRLKIVMEHINSEQTVKLVKSLPAKYVRATITSHHPVLTLDDVVGDKLHPHHFCKPIALRPEDRDAVLEAMLSDDEHFFFGDDSAPHEIGDKECAEGCAGIFNAPVSMPILIHLFKKHGLLHDGRLERYTAIRGPEFYGFKPSTDMVTYVSEPWVVPACYGNVVPFLAGETMEYRLRP